MRTNISPASTGTSPSGPSTTTCSSHSPPSARLTRVPVRTVIRSCDSIRSTRYVVPSQEVPGGTDARGAAGADGRGPDAVHPPLCVELSCEPAAEQRSGGRRAGGCWKHGRAKLAAGEQASGRVETVRHGRRSQPAVHGRATVQGGEP